MCWDKQPFKHKITPTSNLSPINLHSLWTAWRNRSARRKHAQTRRKCKLHTDWPCPDVYNDKVPKVHSMRLACKHAFLSLISTRHEAPHCRIHTLPENDQIKIGGLTDRHCHPWVTEISKDQKVKVTGLHTTNKLNRMSTRIINQ